MKIALITGANRGIGLKFSELLIQQNYFVIGAVRNLEKSSELSRVLGERGKVVELNVGDFDSLFNFSSQLEDITHIDLLINNAGLLKSDAEDLETLAQDIHQSIQVNSIGPMMVFHIVKPWLENSAKPVVANITSLMGSIADNSSGGSYAYRMSKVALNMATKSLVHDFSNITFVLLHPGWVQTDMGGPNARISTEESVTGLIEVIHSLKSSDSGRFINYLGESLPW